jgi:hypothetical protein
MAYPARPDSGAGRTLFAVTLAAVFLAIIGVSVGVVAGRRAVLGGGTPLSTDSPEQPRQPGSSTTAKSPRPSGKPGSATTVNCPDPMVDQSGYRMTLVQYVETDLVEVWICKAAGTGKLWYQGHRKPTPTTRYPAEDLVEGQNALLRDNVNEHTGAERQWIVENADDGKTTTYTVSVSYVTIRQASGTEDRQQVTRHVP